MTEAKFKHLDYVQAAIGRMATNSFLFKGWAVTLAAGLSAFAAVNTKTTLLSIALISNGDVLGARRLLPVARTRLRRVA